MYNRFIMDENIIYKNMSKKEKRCYNESKLREYLKVSVNFKLFYKIRCQTQKSKELGKTNNVLICVRFKTDEEKLH